MPQIIDITGNKYGKLTVLSRGQYGSNKDIKWVCLCECGKVKEISGISLREGRSISCGCWRIEKMQTALGQACKTTEYVIWNGLKGRCYNKKNKDYPNYGGRGIGVCPRWLGKNGFKNFLDDMGKRPSNEYTLDRFPNNETGWYEPLNCRWGTDEQQRRNTRTNRWFEFGDKRMISSDWAREFKISSSALNWYVQKHSFDEAYNHYKNKVA